MTIELQIPKIEYVGDAVTTTFPFTFTADYDSEIVVTVDTTQVQENIDYTLENITSVGGEVEFIIAPANLTKVLIVRLTPLVQQVDLEPFSEFPADSIEWSYDRIIRILQEFASGVQDGGGGDPQLVLSVFGRVGNVTAFVGDYAAAQITYDNTVSGLTAVEVQSAIDEVNSGLQNHTHTHASTTGQTENDHHSRVHSITDQTHHTFPAIPVGEVLMDDATWQLHARLYINAVEPAGAPTGSIWVQPDV